MKGQTFQIEELLKIILVIVISTMGFITIATMSGLLNASFEKFCYENPRWCGEIPSCVCCEVIFHTKLGWPFEDIYSKEYFWNTQDNCIELIMENGGVMYTTDNPEEFYKCGFIPNETIDGGVILYDVCQIPEQFVSDEKQSCLCCKYRPETDIDYKYVWDTGARCNDREESSQVAFDFCGPLYELTFEEARQTIRRISKIYGIGGSYCDIPEPYNYTSPPT